MYIHNRRVLAIAGQIVWNIDESRDRPFAVFAGVVDEGGFGHIFGAYAADEGMRELTRLGVRERIYPEIAGRGRSGVRVEETGAIAGKWRAAAAWPVQAFGQGQGARFSGGDVVGVNLIVAIDIGGVEQRLAIGSEAVAGDLPLVLREPMNLFGRNVEQSGVVVTVAGVRRDEHILAVGRDVIGAVQLLAFVGREQRALAARDLGDEDIGVGALGLLLRIKNKLAIGGPDGRDVHAVFGGAGSEVLYVAQCCVVDVDLKYG